MRFGYNGKNLGSWNQKRNHIQPARAIDFRCWSCMFGGSLVRRWRLCGRLCLPAWLVRKGCPQFKLSCFIVYLAVLWVAKMRSSGPHSFQTRETSCKTMKHVKNQNFENLKTYISYNNLFELTCIEVMEHGCFQGKHKFHNFDKFTYMCYNCYNYHNLLITSASTKGLPSRIQSLCRKPNDVSTSHPTPPPPGQSQKKIW